MPQTCVVGGCTRNTCSHRNVTFLRFPSDHGSRRAWIRFVQTTRSDFKITKWSRICSAHFTENSVDTSVSMQHQFGFQSRFRLKVGAVPSVKAPTNPSYKYDMSNSVSVKPESSSESMWTSRTSKKKSKHEKKKLSQKKDLGTKKRSRTSALAMKNNSLNSSTSKLSSSQRKMNGFSTTEDDSRDSGHGQICCLVDDGQRCSRPAGNACYSKRIAKTVQQRKLKLTIDHSVRHIYICDYHKSIIQSVRSTKKKKRGSDEDGGISPDHDMDVPEVDLFHLQVNTLRRYKRHFKIQTKPGLNKAQLADMVARHFRTIPVREKDALTYFIYMVKNNKSRFDQKHDHS
ncbi:uncharacterized protein [Diadema antillarum]|uniref:uncharacterized protein isoform X1 n=2 Tax=Diadema antillarum TaxID=105358 RepID=UPI003A8761A9